MRKFKEVVVLFSLLAVHYSTVSRQMTTVEPLRVERMVDFLPEKPRETGISLILGLMISKKAERNLLLR